MIWLLLLAVETGVCSGGGCRSERLVCSDGESWPPVGIAVLLILVLGSLQWAVGVCRSYGPFVGAVVGRSDGDSSVGIAVDVGCFLVRSVDEELQW